MGKNGALKVFCEPIRTCGCYMLSMLCRASSKDPDVVNARQKFQCRRANHGGEEMK